jgi:hypothetical protein
MPSEYGSAAWKKNNAAKNAHIIQFYGVEVEPRGMLRAAGRGRAARRTSSRAAGFGPRGAEGPRRTSSRAAGFGPRGAAV